MFSERQPPKSPDQQRLIFGGSEKQFEDRAEHTSGLLDPERLDGASCSSSLILIEGLNIPPTSFFALLGFASLWSTSSEFL
jgi:hypothetical protein